MLKLGVVGIGGYASHVWQGALDAAKCDEPIQLVATCDPRASDQPRFCEALASHGIPVLDRFDALLDCDVDAIWLPIPIDLHRPYTEQALAAGKAVIVEKPAAGTVDEVDSMIAARDRAGLPVAVGFQNLFDPNTWTVKQRLLQGELGEIQRASVIGCWPRSEAYYTRATWAGRASRNGAWVLDSPMNNALAHFVNLGLFLLGHETPTSASPVAVEAELFRAYAIEMFDTCSVRARLDTGVPLLIAMTHACQLPLEPVVTIEGSRGTLRFFHEGNRFEFSNAQGEPVQTLSNRSHPVRQILCQFSDLLAGNGRARVASLENARAHTLLVNAVSEAAIINDVPSGIIDPIRSGGAVTRAIRGVESLLRECAQMGQLASKLPSSPLTANGGRFEIGNYRGFAGPRLEKRPRMVIPQLAVASN